MWCLLSYENVYHMAFNKTSSKYVAGLYYTYINIKHYVCDIGISSFPGAGGVRFSLRGTTYQNNSLVTLDEIGEWDNALLCVTDLTACCKHPFTGEMGLALGNWFFPNGTRVPSEGGHWDFFRARGQMVVHMHRRRGRVRGIYHCEIPDAINNEQTIYIGVYSGSTGE